MVKIKNEKIKHQKVKNERKFMANPKFIIIFFGIKNYFCYFLTLN
jgi:hypothetical protein